MDCRGRLAAIEKAVAAEEGEYMVGILDEIRAVVEYHSRTTGLSYQLRKISKRVVAASQQV